MVKSNIMNTFSIAVSKRLREIGVEEKTGLYFRWWHSPIEEYRTPTLVNETQLKDLSDPILIPAYRLDDIFRLMPKIGEKMGWNNRTNTCIPYDWFIDRGESIEYVGRALLDAFLSGDYPACETVLLDLLKEHE
jgi:hypothetical protein